MVVKKYLKIGLILVTVGALILIFFVDWEARAVKKQLRAIAEEMTWSPADSELTMAVRIKHVQEKIAQNGHVDIPSYNVSQAVAKNDVPAYMMMAKNYIKDLSVKLEDLKVESIQLPYASAVTTAYIKAAGADGQRNDEVLVLKFSLQKVEKVWQVSDVKEIQVLEK